MDFFSPWALPTFVKPHWRLVLVLVLVISPCLLIKMHHPHHKQSLYYGGRCNRSTFVLVVSFLLERTSLSFCCLLFVAAIIIRFLHEHWLIWLFLFCLVLSCLVFTIPSCCAPGIPTNANNTDSDSDSDTNGVNANDTGSICRRDVEHESLFESSPRTPVGSLGPLRPKFSSSHWLDSFLPRILARKKQSQLPGHNTSGKRIVKERNDHDGVGAFHD